MGEEASSEGEKSQQAIGVLSLAWTNRGCNWLIFAAGQ